MPEKHFYFSMGAVVGAGVCVYVAKKRHQLRKTNAFFQWLYRTEPQWFLYFPIVIFLVGLWGLVPDIIHVLGLMPKYETRSAIFDIFFFHSTFEHIENTNGVIDYYLNILGHFILVTLSLGVMIYYVSLIKRATKEKGLR
jgi:hypothetical protein